MQGGRQVGGLINNPPLDRRVYQSDTAECWVYLMSKPPFGGLGRFFLDLIRKPLYPKKGFIILTPLLIRTYG